MFQVWRSSHPVREADVGHASSWSGESTGHLLGRNCLISQGSVLDSSGAGDGGRRTRGHGDKGQRGGGARNVSGTKSSWVTAKLALSGAEGNASPRPIPTSSASATANVQPFDHRQAQDTAPVSGMERRYWANLSYAAAQHGPSPPQPSLSPKGRGGKRNRVPGRSEVRGKGHVESASA